MSYRYIFFDLETTGIHPKEDRIIEIAAYDPQNDARFSYLVNPHMPIPKESAVINGITDAMVKDALSFQEIGYKFFEFCKGDVALVAHNGDGFDFPLLYNESKRNNIPFPSHFLFIDSLLWSRKYRKDLPRHSLQYLRKMYNIPENTAHRALDDVETLYRVFNHMVDDLSPEEVHSRIGSKSLFTNENNIIFEGNDPKKKQEALSLFS